MYLFCLSSLSQFEQRCYRTKVDVGLKIAQGKNFLLLVLEGKTSLDPHRLDLNLQNIDIEADQTKSRKLENIEKKVSTLPTRQQIFGVVIK